MTEKKTVPQNPLKLLGLDSDDIFEDGGFGVVFARAGVGKTSFLVQLGLTAMLNEKKALHISLKDPVAKVNLWYKEVFRHAMNSYVENADQTLFETIASRRFIMTFKAEEFGGAKLEGRIAELADQNIFSPDVILIDGMSFDGDVTELLSGLKDLARQQAVPVWFTMQTHRSEKDGKDDALIPFSKLSDQFDVAVQLYPEDKNIHVKCLKGGGANTRSHFLLDPATMLVQGEENSAS